MDINAQIEKTVENHRDEDLSLLQGLLHIPSLAGGEKPCHDIVAAKMEAAGMELDIFKPPYEELKKALDEFNINTNDEFIKISDWKISGGYNSTIQLFRNSSKRPTAIFLGNSIMALGSLKALRELNLKVPEDVALVSFDSLSFIESTNPPLTTLEKSDNKIGETAAKILYENILNKENKEIKEIYIEAGLSVRESCGCMERRY
jgi:DNA-binding LacI/PurR family transcriptional regulator